MSADASGLDGTPVELEDQDLNDLTMVILNVETRSGRQLSFIIGLEDEDQTLKMRVATFERDATQIVDGQQTVMRDVPAVLNYTFTVERLG